jgi:hypothetical protein
MQQDQDLEALWSVVFLVPGHSRVNAGVVVLDNDRVYGGDSSYYYTGTYETKGGKLTARVKSTYYSGLIGSPLIDFRPQGNIEFVESQRGKNADGNRTITIIGTLVEDRTRKVVAELTWRERLP